MLRKLPKIFISYSRKDIEQAKILEGNLKSAGAEVYVDYETIKLGEPFPDRLGLALEQCDTLILIWSNSAKASSWVAREWQYALQKDKLIIPCKIDTCELPPLLSTINYLDFRGEENVSHLLNKLSLTPGNSSPITDQGIIIYNLRSWPTKLSMREFSDMVRTKGFFDLRQNPNGLGIENKLQIQENKDVVYDSSTGLMWQRSGSKSGMSYREAKKYIATLQSSSFAGYSDWRLPTMEEALSLKKPRKLNGDLFISPVFDASQKWIWTSDHIFTKLLTVSWCVKYFHGHTFYYNNSAKINVRAVR